MREQWNNRLVFVLAAVGSAAGLGNIWRFPYQVASNGGGAFLIPYFIALVTVGIPMLCLEFYMGHRFRSGAPTAWGKICKKGESLGWFSIFVAFMVAAYYSVIIGWIFNYLAFSLNLAWTKTGSSDFFFNNVLKISSGPFNLGGFSKIVVIGVALTWISVYLAIKDGTESVGKIVKYTVALPILLLFIMVIRIAFLDGAISGFDYYLKPDFSKLKDFSVWSAAYGQILLSVGLGYGIMIAYSSYLPKNSDITLNATITALANSGISFLAGFSVFGTLGYIAQATGKTIAEVAGSGGIGMAFVVYPEAITKLPFGYWGQVLFALSFFIMLLTLGIDSAFSLVENVTTALADKFDYSKKKTTKVTISIMFLLSLLFTTKGGLYWLDIMDHYLNNFGLIPIVLIELLLIVKYVKLKNLLKYLDERSDVKFKFGIQIFCFAGISLGLIFAGVVIDEVMSFVRGSFYGGYSGKAIFVGGYLMMIVGIISSILLRKNTEKTELVLEEV